MLIPINEIQNNSDHYSFKAQSVTSLINQLEKISYLSVKVENFLDQKKDDSRWYFTDPAFSYYLDTLIHNFSVTIEYYHSWIVFSHIGTNTHKKTSYSPLKNDEKIDSEIEKIFKSNSIGVLNISKNDQKIYYEECKKTFLKDYEFLLVGNFHEIFTLNNFIKHNTLTMNYAPILSTDKTRISFPYLYIDKPFDRLLNSSVLKTLFNHEFNDDEKIISTKNDYFIDIINNTAQYLTKIGAMKLYHINGIDYVKSKSIVGMSIESILEMTQLLVSKIIKVVIESSPGSITDNKKLTRVINKINKRTPRTIKRFLELNAPNGSSE